jgi:hypothetical protein
MWWAVLNFCVLEGDSQFVHHWAYWQEKIDLFNDKNPSGNVVNDERNRTALSIVISVAIIVAIKRFVVGLYLGRQTFGMFRKI